MRSVYLNIGSNQGDRHANIERAVALITSHPLFADGRLRRAPLVYSKPLGFDSESEFVNLGLALDFINDVLPDPFEVLDATQSIEKQIAPENPHRNADGSYRDRIVDIDIIAMDGVKIRSERLTLPHPRAEARNFVMEPMEFLAPEWRFSAHLSDPDGHTKKSIAEMCRDSVEVFKMKKKYPMVVILDNIRSLNNVGSVFRTADGFCVEKIALCGITATPPSPEIHKTALGAEESVDWIYFSTTQEAVKYFQESGFTIVCLEQVHNSISLHEFRPDVKSKYAIVVGNEVSGVDQSVVDMSDVCLEIPQAGTKHSLNVSVSAAIALWHFFAYYSTNRISKM